MQLTDKVTKIDEFGDFRILHVQFDDDSETTLKVTANPPDGHEIIVGDVVSVHFLPQDGTKAGVSRHPRK